jgi:hypothetical protein
VSPAPAGLLYARTLIAAPCISWRPRLLSILRTPVNNFGAKIMSTDDDALKRRYREFMELLPLTLALAGLSNNEGNRQFTSEQLDLRTQAVVNSFRYARQAVREAVKGSANPS